MAEEASKPISNLQALHVFSWICISSFADAADLSCPIGQTRAPQGVREQGDFHQLAFSAGYGMGHAAPLRQL